MSCFFDTHSHLMLPRFDIDRSEVITRAQKEGVCYILEVGVDLENSVDAVEFSSNYPFVFACCGIHPNSTGPLDQTAIDDLERLVASKPKIVAIGEIGLDFYRNFSPPKKQKEFFELQLELAARLGLPVVIHVRNAFRDVIEILSGFRGNVRGIFHSFSGGIKECKWARDNGFLIGINGTITFSRYPPDYISFLSLDDIVIETDCPYLAPHPFRGRRNEPAYVVYVAKALAEFMRTDIGLVASRTKDNAMRLFCIGETKHEKDSNTTEINRIDLEPIRAFSQVFLANESIAERIADLACVKDKLVVEIGCGKGELTEQLVRRARFVVGVEIDERFHPILEERYKNNFTLIKGDFLALKREDIERLGRPIIVGSIPYSKTSDILFKILEFKDLIEYAVLTLQKEAFQRIFSSPATKEYGPISVVVQNYFEKKVLMELPQSYFYPQPKVDSMLVKLIPRNKPLVDVDLGRFKLFLNRAFSKRRKTILNALKGFYKLDRLERLLDDLGLSRTVRAEELEIEILGELAKRIYS